MSAKVKTFPSNIELERSHRVLDLSEPRIMAILNATPDSFFDGGKYNTIEQGLKKAEEHLNNGAHILDVGGYSTRPGAPEVSEEEEIKRTAPFIEALRKEFPEVIISIDTFRSEVAKKGVEAGADIINDVSGGNLDSNMFATVAQLKVAYILMHMRGTPATMQQLTNYVNLTEEVTSELRTKVELLNSLGVQNIILDPGFGFAKTIEQNYLLLRELKKLKSLNLPILAGVSRKSMIYKLLNSSANEIKSETQVVNTLAVLNGTDILRVHDVTETKNTLTIIKTYFQD